MILSSPINDRCFNEWFSQPIVSNPGISSCSDTNFVDMSNICMCEICRVPNGLTIVQVTLSHEYCWFHCDRHEHSPSFRTFVHILCNIWNSFLFFSNQIIHPITNDLDSNDLFQFCFIVSNDELLRPSSSLKIDIGSSRSVTKHYLIHNGLRGSCMKGFLVREKRSRISRVALQEVSSGRPDRSYISVPVIHSWEDQARSSSHFE